MNFMNFTTAEQLALTLLELSDDFGTRDGEVTCFGLPLRQRDLAELVGGSRPRVTEHLARLEPELLVVRQGQTGELNSKREEQLTEVFCPRPLASI
jgi:hypothetical protein